MSSNILTPIRPHNIIRLKKHLDHCKVPQDTFKALGHANYHKFHHSTNFEKVWVEILRPLKVYKKVYTPLLGSSCIATLILVPNEVALLGFSRPKSAFSRINKCRTTVAYVESINHYTGQRLNEARSEHNPRFIYKVGDIVQPARPFDYWGEECASGIHFYLTRQEAENHY